MRCRICDSENLIMTESGMHKKLTCNDCGSFQKFLNKKELEELKGVREMKKLFQEDEPINEFEVVLNTVKLAMDKLVDIDRQTEARKKIIIRLFDIEEILESCIKSEGGK